MQEQNLYLELWFEQIVSAGRFLPPQARQECVKRMHEYMDEKENAKAQPLAECVALEEKAIAG